MILVRMIMGGGGEQKLEGVQHGPGRGIQPEQSFCIGLPAPEQNVDIIFFLNILFRDSLFRFWAPDLPVPGWFVRTRIRLCHSSPLRKRLLQLMGRGAGSVPGRHKHTLNYIFSNTYSYTQISLNRDARHPVFESIVVPINFLQSYQSLTLIQNSFNLILTFLPFIFKPLTPH